MSTREEEKKKPPPTTQKEGKKKIFGPPLPEGREKEEEREGQQQPPTCSSGQVQAAAAPMGLPKMLTGQFLFFQQINNSHTFLMKQEKSTMLITVPSLIAAGIATAVVTGGITVTAVYLTAGDADVVTGEQIKTKGGAAHPQAGPHGAMGHSNDVRDHPHRHGQMWRLLPQTRKELRHGQRGKAQRPRTRTVKGAGAHGCPRSGQSLAGRPNVP
jgi:hypothetical protein